MVETSVNLFLSMANFDPEIIFCYRSINYCQKFGNFLVFLELGYTFSARGYKFRRHLKSTLKS